MEDAAGAAADSADAPTGEAESEIGDLAGEPVAADPQEPAEPDTVAFREDCLLFIQHGLLEDPQAFPFALPVDPVLHNLPDYPLIIKNPMDLSTVQQKLETGAYAEMGELKADLDQIWANAKTFNRPGEPVYNMAEAMESLCDREWTRLLSSIESAKLGDGVVVQVSDDQSSVLVRYENGVERWESLKDLDIEGADPEPAPAAQPAKKKTPAKSSAAGRGRGRPKAPTESVKGSRSSARTPKPNRLYEDNDAADSGAAGRGKPTGAAAAAVPPAAELPLEEDWMCTDAQLAEDKDRVDKWVAEYGEAFWVKVPGYPLWPGRCGHIVEVRPEMRVVPKDKVLVHFFGEASYAWVRPTAITQGAFDESVSADVKNKKLASAIDAVRAFLGTVADERIIPMWMPPQKERKAAQARAAASASAAAQQAAPAKRRASDGGAMGRDAKRARTKPTDSHDDDTSMKKCDTCREEHPANSMWRSPKKADRPNAARKFLCQGCVDKATPILKTMISQFKN